jgi:hypothetical protein
MNTLTLRVATRYIASRKSYVVDRAIVRKELQGYNNPRVVEDSKKEFGGYALARFKYVPISKINLPEVWNPSRVKRIKEGIEQGKALPPIHLSSNMEISDGIHRTNVSKEMGFTHVPAIVTYWIETPEAEVPPEPEKPQLDLGDWVKLRKPYDGRIYGWVAEQLRYRIYKGVKRWVYNIALVDKNSKWPDYPDMSDTEFDPVKPPSWAIEIKKSFKM